MKSTINILIKAGGLFGYLAFLITLMIEVISNQPVLSNYDGYGFSWTIAWLVFPAILLFLLFERFLGKPYQYIGIAIYSFLVIAFGAWVEIDAKEAGFGYLIIAAYTIGSVLTFPFIKYLSNHRLLAVFWCLGGLYALGYILAIIKEWHHV